MRKEPFLPFFPQKNGSHFYFIHGAELVIFLLQATAFQNCPVGNLSIFSLAAALLLGQQLA